MYKQFFPNNSLRQCKTRLPIKPLTSKEEKEKKTKQKSIVVTAKKEEKCLKRAENLERKTTSGIDHKTMPVVVVRPNIVRKSNPPLLSITLLSIILRGRPGQGGRLCRHPCLEGALRLHQTLAD